MDAPSVQDHRKSPSFCSSFQILTYSPFELSGPNMRTPINYISVIRQCIKLKVDIKFQIVDDIIFF